MTAPVTPTTSTGAVTVTPERFSLVDYDSATIAAVADDLIENIGLPSGFRLRFDVDEETFMGLSELDEIDPEVPMAVLSAGSGALEDPLKPRQFSQTAATNVLGRHLMRIRDRLTPGFGDPGPDKDLSLPLTAAWDSYAVGRLGRLGYPVKRQRRLYQFRVRHGFNDAVDEAFSRLWDGQDLTWQGIQLLSEAAGR